MICIKNDTILRKVRQLPAKVTLDVKRGGIVVEMWMFLFYKYRKPFQTNVALFSTVSKYMSWTFKCFSDVDTLIVYFNH